MRNFLSVLAGVIISSCTKDDMGFAMAQSCDNVAALGGRPGKCGKSNDCCWSDEHCFSGCCDFDTHECIRYNKRSRDDYACMYDGARWTKSHNFGRGEFDEDKDDQEKRWSDDWLNKDDSETINKGRPFPRREQKDRILQSVNSDDRNLQEIDNDDDDDDNDDRRGKRGQGRDGGRRGDGERGNGERGNGERGNGQRGRGGRGGPSTRQNYAARKFVIEYYREMWENSPDQNTDFNLTEFKPEWDEYVENHDESVSFEEWAHAYEEWEENELSEPTQWKDYIKEWEQFKKSGGTSNRREGWRGFMDGKDEHKKERGQDCFEVAKDMKTTRMTIKVALQLTLVLVWIIVFIVGCCKLSKTYKQQKHEEMLIGAAVAKSTEKVLQLQLQADELRLQGGRSAFEMQGIVQGVNVDAPPVGSYPTVVSPNDGRQAASNSKMINKLNQADQLA